MPRDACTISPADCYIVWHQYHAKRCMHYFTSRLLHCMTSVSCQAMHALFHQPTVTFYDISIMPSDACTISPANCYILWHQYHAAWCMHYFTSRLLHSMTSVSCQAMHALFHQPTVTFYDISIMPRDACTISPATCYILWHQYHAKRCMHYFTSRLLHSMTSVSCQAMHALFHQPTATFHDISIMPRDACTISPADCYILWHQYHAKRCMHYFTSRLLHSMTSVSCQVMHALFHQPTVTFYDISIMPSDACTISPADCYILWHQYHAAWCMHYFTSRLLHSMTSVSCPVMHALFHQPTVIFYDISIMPSDACTISPADCYIVWHQYHAKRCMHYFTSQLLHSMTSVSCQAMHALFHQPTVTFYDISIMPRDACTISPANCYILWHQYHAAWCMHYFTSQLLHSMTSVSCQAMHALFHQPTVTFYDISIMPSDACTISPAECYIIWHQYHAAWCMHYFTSQLLHSMTSVSCRVMHALFHQPTVTFYDISIMPSDACTISPADCYILWHQYHAKWCMHYFTSQLLHSMTSVSCQAMHALFHQPTVTFYDISIMPRDACTISPANCYILWHQYHAAWCMHYFTSQLLHSMASVSCRAMHALFHQPTVIFYDISIMPRDACTISPADCYILWHQYHAAWCMHYFTSQLLHSMTSVSCRVMHALFHQPTVTFYDISIMPRDACTILPADCYILWHQYHAAWCMHYFTSQLLHSMTSVSCQAMHALFYQPTVTFYDISIMPHDACTISPADCYILWHQYHAVWCMHYFTSRLLHSMTSVSCRVMHALFHQPTVTFYDISIMPRDACTISPANCYILWHQYHAAWCMHCFTSQLLHCMTSVSCQAMHALFHQPTVTFYDISIMPRDACTISPADCYILWHQYHAKRCMHYFTSRLLHCMTSVSCQAMHALFHQPTVTFYDISIMPSDACTISPANCYILWHQYHAAWCMHYFTSQLLHSMTSVSCRVMHALFHQPTVTFYDISIMPSDACTISPADCYIL